MKERDRDRQTKKETNRKREWEREREKQRERQAEENRQREWERERQRQADKERDKQKERVREKQGEKGERDREREMETVIQIDGWKKEVIGKMYHCAWQPCLHPSAHSNASWVSDVSYCVHRPIYHKINAVQCIILYQAECVWAWDSWIFHSVSGLLWLTNLLDLR